MYVASTRSLAVLEMAVHLHRSAILESFVLIPCQLDEWLVSAVDRGALPADWRSDPPPSELAAVGDTWIREHRSPALAVPSAVIPEELNYLLNPAHPRFPQIRIGVPQAFEFDRRLIEPRKRGRRVVEAAVTVSPARVQLG